MRVATKLMAAALLSSLMQPAYGETQAAGSAASAPSPSIENAAAPETVIIQGIRSAYSLSYARLLLAKRAFAQHSDKAPNADLFFEVIQLAKGLPPTRLSLAVEDESISIPLTIEDRFLIPELTISNPETAVITTNQKATQILIRPVVRTRNLAPDRLRLGDLRASCETTWAMERADVSLAVRAAFAAAGGVCESPKIVNSFRLRQPAQSATLIDNNKATPVRLSRSGDRIFPPLSDTSLTNDALIVMVLKRPEAEQSESPIQRGSQ
jgi:hypothetical protein